MVRRGPLPLLNGQFELIKQSQSGTSFLLHYTMGHFTIEADLEHAKRVLNQVKIVHFGLLIPPVSVCNLSYSNG